MKTKPKPKYISGRDPRPCPHCTGEIWVIQKIAKDTYQFVCNVCDAQLTGNGRTVREAIWDYNNKQG